jgi:serine/threonine protein kinase
MQEVYVSRDQVLNRRVALKTPKNNSAAKRFEKSASLSARISNPYVAKTFDYFIFNSRAYLVEELIQGENLDDALKSVSYILDPHLAAQAAHQLAKALKSSHDMGVFHRDLKPNNIIVEENEGSLSFKITDFGISKLVEDELEKAVKSSQSMQESSTMFGALPYMSPEVIYDPKAGTLASDIWAFGAIIYRILAGTLPYGEGLSAIPKIVSGNLPLVPDAFSFRHQFSPVRLELWEIIKDCLKMDPLARPNASQLVERMSNMCYSTFPRKIGLIQNYASSEYGEYGFIQSSSGNIFFHKDSFFGDKIKVGQLVYFSDYAGFPKNRAHPVLPIARNFRGLD